MKNQGVGRFVVSLDFELFWGVAASKTIDEYRNNLLGVPFVIPRMLDLFDSYGIRATWATVGMLMCESYEHWLQLKPVSAPKYRNKQLSTYCLGDSVKIYPELFFAPNLVRQIGSCAGQEVATHTFSHMYCDYPEVSADDFIEDIGIATRLAESFGLRIKSIVFPRNQVRQDFLPLLKSVGISAYRGNRKVAMYQGGDGPGTPKVVKALRYLDTWCPISGGEPGNVEQEYGLINVPASAFLRPLSPKNTVFAPLQISRLKGLMLAAAKSGGVFHLWWHPHNYGINIESNMLVLKNILEYAKYLNERFGFQSVNMQDFIEAKN